MAALMSVAMDIPGNRFSVGRFVLAAAVRSVRGPECAERPVPRAILDVKSVFSLASGRAAANSDDALRRDEISTKPPNELNFNG
tara:strand:+ start:737 stop:988 length:252 start_codon:yes stop_codon:yes gene_type:complete